MTDPQIIFQGIECPSLRQQINALVEDLTQLCPSDSCVKATFRHIQDRFLAEIKIASESTFMQVADSAAVFNDVLEHMRTKLMGQIVDWRNHRFAS